MRNLIIAAVCAAVVACTAGSAQDKSAPNDEDAGGSVTGNPNSATFDAGGSSAGVGGTFANGAGGATVEEASADAGTTRVATHPTADRGGALDGLAPRPATKNVVACAEGKSCTTSQVCCYTAATTFPPPGTTSQYTCSDKPCTGGDVSVSCDGDEDCKSGQRCCRVDAASGLLSTSTSYTCRAACEAATVGCSGPENCPDGTVCCETVLGLTASKTECATTCEGTGLYIMCETDVDCPADAPTCIDSTALPGLHRCD